MIIDYVGVKEINGSLIVIDGVKGVSNEEIVDIKLENGSTRQGRVVQIEGDRIVVQVFEGTRRISLKNTRTRLTGHPMEMPLSPEIIGRVLDGARHAYQPRFESIPQELHQHRYLDDRHTDDAYPRSEAAYLLRLGYDPQRPCGSDRASGENQRR